MAKITKQTTKKLLNDLLSMETEIETGLLPKDSKTKKKLTTIRNSLQKKMQDIDSFQLELKTMEEVLKAEMKVHQEEMQRIASKVKKALQVRAFFDTQLIPRIIKEAGDADGVYQTKTARYTLYETYGGVEIDEENCPPKYKKAKVEHYIDEKQAREDAIEADKNGKTIQGLRIRRAERVRKS